MSATATRPAPVGLGTPELPPAGRSALRGGVMGNFVDNVHVFLPVVALAPALAGLVGSASATAGSAIVVAMLFGRPVGGAVFGRVSDRRGRTRTTRLAITGTATCAALIALLPGHAVLGVGTLVAVLALRFIGGVFVAGEYSAAIPLAMEWSEPRRRGWMSGLILSMASWAQAAIAFATAGLLALLGTHAYAGWGWRLLFLLGALGSVGMLLYYRSRVTDAPTFHRSASGRGRAQVDPAPVADASATHPVGAVLREHARPFWCAFALMTGLWLLTDTTVLVLPSRLLHDVGLAPSTEALVMGLAAVVQAVCMAALGHASTLVGRRRFFMLWGVVVAVAGPLAWLGTVHARGAVAAAVGAALLQAVTVSGYGPVSAWLSELFPRAVRSTGYGMAYSWSLVLPALYPFYLAPLEHALGHQAAVVALVVLGGVLVTLAAATSPRRPLGPLDRVDPDDAAVPARTGALDAH